MRFLWINDDNPSISTVVLWISDDDLEMEKQVSGFIYLF